MRWFYELLSLSLGVTPIIILLLCFNPILKKRYSTKWRYNLWIAVSICLLLPFSYVKDFLVSLKIPETVPSELLPSTSVVAQLPKINHINLYNVNDSRGEVLFAIYFSGVILYLVYVIFSYIVYRREIIRWSRKTSNYKIQTILRNEKKRLNIERYVSLLISKKVSSPMLIGFISPTLVLPSEEYTPEELKMILTHELVHLKRNDILIKTILTAASVVHWFNPTVHLLVKQANKDMEQSCDDYVLNECNIEEKKFYCNIILKMAAMNNKTLVPVFSTNIVSNRKNLESRIKGIFDSSKKKRGITVLIVTILLVMISGTIFNVIGVEQPEKISFQNEFLDEHMDFITENNTKNEVKTGIENTELGIISEIENAVHINESNKPEVMEYEDLSTQQDNIQQVESSIWNSKEIKEEIIVENDMSEIIIVDLNQLENQLQESEIVE
ncbi:MAG: M56 family metallopeptidase [Sedimentibacter saalensis]|uniref:M56 family metallopeptidase n=1 Tax=Sedimentibacter saalensis TaxID=130788 RepID=UPI002B218E4A|nr:M56 family metallopeptidase [Sedimentibacter saalensis]MEA5094988.1 M56 family metallopeptidase [Sedimentibacter saalensis]